MCLSGYVYCIWWDQPTLCESVEGVGVAETGSAVEEVFGKRKQLLRQVIHV